MLPCFFIFLVFLSSDVDICNGSISSFIWGHVCEQLSLEGSVPVPLREEKINFCDSNNTKQTSYRNPTKII
jgi:hypothetical protein